MAFCGAIRAAGAPTRATAVDTWQGDAFTGNYGSLVLEKLKAAHDPAYGDFSRLLQTTFDQAATEFGPGTIDLLHIDGAHDYANARHDFDTWLPRLSDHGVVLMHDTAERQEGFGVWKVWEEVRAGRPHAELPYGHGLGILAVGRQVGRPLLDFLDAVNSDPRLVGELRALGERVQMFCNFMTLAGALDGCQRVVAEWRTAIGQPVFKAAHGMQRAIQNPSDFGSATQLEVRQLANDAVALAREVITLRQQVAARSA
jgi:hypothetical protein